jgi:hypothetical protein
MRRHSLFILTFLLALAASSAPASAASAPDPLASATTTLTIAVPFQRLLVTNGVTLTATAPASGKQGSFKLPLGEGSVDPLAKRLGLSSEGALVFSRGHRKVILRQLDLKTAQVPLLAKVGGGQLKLASATKRKFSRQGFGSAFSATGLHLTAKFATRLSKKLGLHDVFTEGQLLGKVGAAVAPANVAVLPEGRATLTPDPAFLAKLDSLFVSLNPVSPAERAPGPLFTVPFIPAGTIAPDASSGVPRSGGSLEFLQLGAGQVFWHELWFDLANHQVLAEVDIEPTPTFLGKLGQIPILELAAGTVSSDPKGRIVAVSGAGLALNAQTAAAFNEAFAKPRGKADVFQPGEALGTLTFTAHTQ